MLRCGVGTIVAVVIGSLMAGCERAQADRAQSAERADLVLLHGKVLTIDAADRMAEAIAVKAGKIIAVGRDQEIERHVGSGTRVVDLRGRTVTPGLIDSHVHFSAAAELYSIDLSDVAITKMADIVGRVAARVKELKPGEWVQGRGWDEGKLAERRYITAADLDAVSPDNQPAGRLRRQCLRIAVDHPRSWHGCSATSTRDTRKRREHFSGGLATTTPPILDLSARCG